MNNSACCEIDLSRSVSPLFVQTPLGVKWISFSLTYGESVEQRCEGCHPFILPIHFHNIADRKTPFMNIDKLIISLAKECFFCKIKFQPSLQNKCLEGLRILTFKTTPLS